MSRVQNYSANTIIDLADQVADGLLRRWVESMRQGKSDEVVKKDLQRVWLIRSAAPYLTRADRVNAYAYLDRY